MGKEVSLTKEISHLCLIRNDSADEAYRHFPLCPVIFSLFCFCYHNLIFPLCFLVVYGENNAGDGAPVAF